MPRKKTTLPAPDIKITSITGLIHSDVPELPWRNDQTGRIEMCRKKLIYAEELYAALGLENSHRARTIQRWLSKGFEGTDWIGKIGESITGRGRILKFDSAYLRVEFAKKICMQVNTPIADKVRDYLIGETRAAWEQAKRAAIAVADPAMPAIPLSSAIQKIINKAVSDAVATAVHETTERNQAASRALFAQKFAVLEDLREKKTAARKAKNLRSHIGNLVRKHCYESGTNYKLFWDRCYVSFEVRHKGCDWFWAFKQAKNKVEFIAENLPAKYLEEFHQIVVSYILEK